MSTQQNALHQSTLVESHNPSTFDKRMARLKAGDTLENKPNKMPDEEFEQKFGFSPNTTNTTRNAKGGRRRKQTKRRRSTKRRRGSKRRK